MLNGTVSPQESTQEKEGREEKSQEEFTRRGKDALPARYRWMDKRPKLLVALGGQIGMMGVVHDAKERQAHVARRADSCTRRTEVFVHTELAPAGVCVRMSATLGGQKKLPLGLCDKRLQDGL